MKARGSATSERTQDELLAEAGVWLARLQSSDRTASVDEGFRKWLNESSAHAAAFETVTDVWEKSARLQRRTSERLARWELPGFRVRLSRAAMAAAAAIVITVLVFHLRAHDVSTGIGEQRMLTLEDGSRVYLNTTTQAQVLYDEHIRQVRLDRGEALFEVVQESARPFEVLAGDRKIQALGTSFVVRREAQKLSVTLMDGKVAVRPVIASDRPGSASGTTVPADMPDNEAIMLAPGERLTLVANRAPERDRPALDKVTAWQRGQVALDGQNLIEAAIEMNRYSTTRLIVESARADDLHVSGVFRAGDSENFALGLSKTYGLEIVRGSGTIVIRDPEHGASRKESASP